MHRVTVAAGDAVFGKQNSEVQVCIHIPVHSRIQPFFRPLPLDQLHLLSNIRPKISFEPWSGGDWSFSYHLIDVGLTL